MDFTACGVISGYQISATEPVFTFSTAAEGSRRHPSRYANVVCLPNEACRRDKEET